MSLTIINHKNHKIDNDLFLKLENAFNLIRKEENLGDCSVNLKIVDCPLGVEALCVKCARADNLVKRSNRPSGSLCDIVTVNTLITYSNGLTHSIMKNWPFLRLK